MADVEDLESPAVALARQARMEARIGSLLARALRGFLGWMREAVVEAGFALTAADIGAHWAEEVTTALDSPQVTDEAREYLLDALIGESAIPGDAHAAAVALLVLAHDGGWPRDELRRVAVEVFDPREGEARSFLEAAARRYPRHGADWEALDRAAGGDWMAKMRREARTAVTGLDGLLTSTKLAEQGYTRRTWVTRRDDHVRHEHALADRQTVGLDETFLVGGYPMRYPGDRLGVPIGLWISCRCVVVGTRWRKTRNF